MIKQRVLFFLSVIFLIVFVSCYPLSLQNATKYITPIPQTTKQLDIPKYPNGYPYTFWHFCKQKEKQLNLFGLEQNFDSLICRIWITNPISKRNQPHGLIEIKYDSAKWIGQLILMRVDLNVRELQEKITTYKVWDLTPKTSWEFIVDSLFKLQIDSLPTDEKIPNYYTEETRYTNNATTFSFEYSTKADYRFYQYSNIYRVPDKFWQPRNVISMLNLLDNEFKWDSIGRRYFK